MQYPKIPACSKKTLIMRQTNALCIVSALVAILIGNQMAFAKQDLKSWATTDVPGLTVLYPSCWRTGEESLKDKKVGLYQSTTDKKHLSLTGWKCPNSTEFVKDWRVELSVSVKQDNLGKIGKDMANSVPQMRELNNWYIEVSCGKSLILKVQYHESSTMAEEAKKKNQSVPPILKEFLEGIDCSKVK